MLPPSTSPSATGSSGCRRAGAGEEDEHPADGDGGQGDHDDVVASAKRPKAIPEFWTWWIENGPAISHRLAERERAGDDDRFVSWSATTAAPAIDERARATAPARAERAARRPRSGCSAFVDEPTRTSSGRAAPSRRAGSLNPAPAVALSSMQSVAYGIGVEPLDRDRLAADARSVPYVPVVDPRERVVDLADDVRRAFSSSVLVELAVDDVARVVGEVLVAGRRS